MALTGAKEFMEWEMTQDDAFDDHIDEEQSWVRTNRMEQRYDSDEENVVKYPDNFTGREFMSPVEGANRHREDVEMATTSKEFGIPSQNKHTRKASPRSHVLGNQTSLEEGSQSGGDKFQAMEGDDDTYFYDEDLTARSRPDGDDRSLNLNTEMRSRTGSDSDLVFRQPTQTPSCGKQIFRYVVIGVLALALGFLFGYIAASGGEKTTSPTATQLANTTLSASIPPSTPTSPGTTTTTTEKEDSPTSVATTSKKNSKGS